MLLVLVLAISASATEIPRMHIVALDESKTLVAAVTDPDVASEITIENDAGEIVYYRKTKAGAQFKSIFDLSELNDGKYTVNLKSGKVRAQRELEINQGKVNVLQVIQEMAPFFTYDGELLRLSYLNFGKEDVSIDIYNGSKLVQSSELGNKFTINHAFDVSNMVKGNFDFVLSGPNHTYSYRITR